MATRVYFIPGIVLLFCAFILSLLVTISLPDLPTLDIVRCRFTTIHDALPYLLSDTRVGSLLLLTLITLLILFYILSLSVVWCLVRKSLRPYR
jgi:hypothetical protein